VNVQQAIPAPLNYRGFPKTICTSVNHVVCHGIPGDKRLKQGDIVNIDVTVIKDGYHGDTSRMYCRQAAPQAQRLCDLTFEACGSASARCGRARSWATSATPSSSSSRPTTSVVREYCGHGIGRVLPRGPAGAALRRPGTGPRTEAARHDLHDRAHGQRRQARGALLPDGWTVVTKDHSLSAQWEHTVLVTVTASRC
jgi:methionyl aminopeptidase